MSLCLFYRTQSESHTNSSQPRKIFLDCGANMASSVLMFRELYPNAKEFEIHSFEIDNKLRPYFASYISQGIVNAHIPVGVSSDNGKNHNLCTQRKYICMGYLSLSLSLSVCLSICLFHQ